MIKLDSVTHLMALLLAASPLSQGAGLELFEFDDTAGTSATATANTGTPGTLVHPAIGTNTYETNGAGQALFTFAANSFTGSSLPSPASSGKIFLRTDLGGHNLTSSASDAIFGYQLRDTTTNSTLSVRLQKNATDSIRLSVQDFDPVGGVNVTTTVNIGYAGLVDTTGIGTILALDIDAGSYDVYSDVGLTGTFTKVISNLALQTPATFQNDNVNQLRLITQNIQVGDTVTVNRVAVAGSLENVAFGDTVLEATNLFDFNDASGTTVETAANTAGTMDHPAAGTNTYETNGSGQALYTSAGANVFVNGNLASPASSGKIALRADIAGHNIASSATQAQLVYGFRDSTSTSNLVVRLQKTGTDVVRISVLDDDNVNLGSDVNSNVLTNFAGLVDTAGIGLILVLDIDAGTYDLFADVGLTGSFKQVISNLALNTPGTFQTNNLNQLRFFAQNFGAGDTVSVERIATGTDLDSVLFGDSVSALSELFEFDDPAATTADTAANTGNPGTMLHPSFDTNTYETNGSGQAVFTFAASTFQTRPLPSAVSSGTIFLRNDIAGHDIASSTSQAVFNYGFRDSVSTSQLNVRLNKLESTNADPDSIRLSVQDDDNDGTLTTNFYGANLNYAGLVDTAGISTILGLNIDAGTFDLYTDVGFTGLYTKVIADQALADPLTFQTSGVNQLRFFAQNMTVGDTITVERLAIGDSLNDIVLGGVAPIDLDTFSVPGADFLAMANADAANGFTIIGNGIADYSDATNFFTSRALSSPISSGKAFLRLDVSEYSTIEDSSDNYQIGLRDADGDLVSIQFSAFNSGDAKRIRTASAVGGVGIDFANVNTVPNLGDDLASSIILEIDIDNDEYSAYLENGGTYYCVAGPLPFQDGGALPVDIGPITEVRMGIQAMEATDVVGIDFIMIGDSFSQISSYVPPANPIVVTGDIVITDSSVTGGNFLATFTSSGNVDVYSSTDLLSWGSPILTDVAPGTDVSFGSAAASETYYILVPTGTPAP